MLRRLGREQRRPVRLRDDRLAQVDALARKFAGVPVKLTAPPLWLVTQRNLPTTTGVFPVVAGYKAQSPKLWGDT
jgi:hypothetical protein